MIAAFQPWLYICVDAGAFESVYLIVAGRRSLVMLEENWSVAWRRIGSLGRRFVSGDYQALGRWRGSKRKQQVLGVLAIEFSHQSVFLHNVH